MKLEIIVTHWTEDWEIGKDGFRMLELQRDVDWSNVKVTLIHDGSEPFPDEYFHLPCAFEQVTIPHCGIAAVRNYGIDHSTADWIRFNDFDDMFSGVYSVSAIMKAIEHADNYDLLWFPVYAQLVDGRRYIKKHRDPVVVHGKVFRREFLNRINLRFNERLTWCEDSAFLAVMEMEIDRKRIGMIRADAPIYLWIARQGSLCNRPEILFQNRKSFFERHRFVAEQFLAHGMKLEHDMMVVRVMGDSYHTLKKLNLPDDTSEHEKEVWEYFDAHRDDFYRNSPQDFDFVIRAVNNENKPGFTKEEFMEWIHSHEADGGEQHV